MQSISSIRVRSWPRQVRRSISGSAERIYVMADPVRLGQCFSNLFTNAAKYTNLGGRIDVSLARDHEGAVVHVRDIAARREPPRR